MTLQEGTEHALTVLGLHGIIIVPKAWGYEAVIYDGPDYCAKVLVFIPSSRGSMHFHRIKRETWLVRSGIGVLRCPDPATGRIAHRPMVPGFVVTLDPGQAHQVCAQGNDPLIIFESSTPHRDEDTFRINPFS